MDVFAILQIYLSFNVSNSEVPWRQFDPLSFAIRMLGGSGAVLSLVLTILTTQV